MKKTLYAALFLALLAVPAAAASAAGGAGCANQTPFTPALTSTAQASAMAQDASPLAGEMLDAEAAALLDAGIIESTEIQVLDIDFELCRWWNCILTPTGCGCAGFYCNGNFICGYKIK
jgi:hypothetical protein